MLYSKNISIKQFISQTKKSNPLFCFNLQGHKCQITKFQIFFIVKTNKMPLIFRYLKKENKHVIQIFVFILIQTLEKFKSM